MKTVRRFVYALALTVGVVSLIPSAASAQSAAGVFTLPHEVRWQQFRVPAGEYRFSLESHGASQLLTLRQLDGTHEGFLILVNGVQSNQETGLNRLVLVSREGKSFVRTLELPEFGSTITFAVPSESVDKEVALAGEHSDPTHLR
jgi:hypothetical protein